MKQKNKGAHKKMQKIRTVDTVRGRESQFSKTRVFLWNCNKNNDRKIEGRDTFIHNGKKQTIEVKTLPHIERYTKSRVHIGKF